ncbi:MAG TPA: DUF4139 domain-containing protein [Candidatus Omnitrophota bacterium]|nr:DUF4139 domain-containing protein [Candidatus Omnitrophota bacterium]
MKFAIPKLCLMFVLTAQLCLAQEVQKSTIDDQKNVEVTVYNSDIGLVKDTRRINLRQGEGELRFMDVAAYINPVTVHIKSLNNPKSFMVLEQNYEYDLMDANKLLDKYVGQKVKLLTYNEYQDKKEEIEAELLSNNNGQIFKIGNEIHLGHPGFKILPKIPENLIAKPTLSWQYDNSGAKEHEVEVSYLTNYINWKADYIVVLNQDDTKADLSGWVSLDNRSGTMYNNAKLKLVAGEINRVYDAVGGLRSDMVAKSAMAMESAPQFVEQGFFEYHIYDLQRRTTIKNNQTKQINLLEAADIKTEKELLVHGQNYYFIGQYAGQELKDPVEVFVKFKNEKENNLGMPLPAGTMRLYKKDQEDSLQFIGEDRIEHTPKDEEVELKIGKAFDVVEERKQSAFQSEYLGGDYVYESEWEITLRNHKEEDVVVGIIEPMAYANWQILTATHPYEKKDAFTVQFTVPVPKDKEVKLIYRIEVSSSKSRLSKQ